MRTPEGWPEPGPYVGREAVMREFEQLQETWDTYTLRKGRSFYQEFFWDHGEALEAVGLGSSAGVPGRGRTI
jgi:hypothetical protein